MDKQHESLQQLLELTERILLKAKTIHSKMEDNEAEDLVEVQGLFEQRQAVIDGLEAVRIESGFDWSPDGKAMAARLHEAERQLNPLMQSLHQAFTKQMNRISQTKQLSQKYRNSYQTAPADGTFFDIRK